MKPLEAEKERYLAEFRQAKYFAAIKAGGECLNSDLADSLAALYNQMLLPVLVHGGGRQFDEALKAKGIVSKKIDGKRVTDKASLDCIVSASKSVNEGFVAKINRLKHCAKGFNGLFRVDGPDSVFGYVGNVVGVDIPAIDACLKGGLIPVVSSLGTDNKGQYYNPNADSAFKFMVAQLKPKKVIFLTPAGGVFYHSWLISEMNCEELAKLLDSPDVNGGMKLKLKEVKDLIDSDFAVQITSPQNLMDELFTRRGCGTYIHR